MSSAAFYEAMKPSPAYYDNNSRARGAPCACHGGSRCPHQEWLDILSRIVVLLHGGASQLTRRHEQGHQLRARTATAQSRRACK